MTMNEIRKEFKKRAAFAEKNIAPELGEYFMETLNTIEAIYAEGFTREYSEDFLRSANGYKINTADPEFRISDCLDLHCIKASKKSIKAFAENWLN